MGWHILVFCSVTLLPCKNDSVHSLILLTHAGFITSSAGPGNEEVQPGNRVRETILGMGGAQT